MAINKVVFGNDVLIDLTADTVDAAHLLTGHTAHDKSGAVINGACTYDLDTSGATASQAEILAGETAGVGGAIITGTMPNIGRQTSTISTKDQSVAISQGYHDGSGSVAISATEQAKIIPSNLKAGVVILGQTGTYSGEAVSAQAKTATPSKTSQTILPDSGYDYLSQVTVNAIPYTETNNSAGGKTATIAGA